MLRGPRLRRTRLLVPAAVVLLGVALLTAGGALAGGSGPHYRLATASIGSVDQTLSEVGTVSAVNRATVSFPVAGTVAAVAVSVGDRVAAGQVLASLSTTALSQQLASTTAALASAQQTLAADEASQTGSGSSAGSGSGSGSGAESTAVLSAFRIGTAPASARPSSTSAAGSTTRSRSVSQLAAAVTAAQQAVLVAQRSLDADLAAAEQALSSCRAALSQPSGSPSPSSTATASPTASSSPTGSPSPTGSGNPGSAQCLAAIAQAPGADRVTADQRDRAAAERSLDAAVRALTSAAGKAATGSSGTGSSGSGATSRGSSGSGSNGTSGGSNRATGPVTAEQLAADQAEIDAAVAQQDLARQNLAAAVLASPMDGTVAAVSLAPGKAVGASASNAGITVIGSGSEQVSTTVGLADIDSVRVGQPATVRVDGVGAALTGKVSSVGILNSTSGSSTSYPVTVLLDPSSARLFDGSGASVQILLNRVIGVLTVPSSAVHAIGPVRTVQVLRNGKPTQVRVTVGAVGSERTQIRNGLSAGDQVVLADLATPLPS